MAWVDGEIGSQESEGMLPLLPSETPPPHKSVFVGDLRLADFKQLLASRGIQVGNPSFSVWIICCVDCRARVDTVDLYPYIRDMICFTFLQAEFAGGVLRCGDAFAVRKVRFAALTCSL